MNSNIFILFSLLFLIIYGLLQSLTPSVEGYQSVAVDSSLEQCAHFCKVTAGCQGFGYDPIARKCYPSRNIITNAPQYGNAKDEYKPEHMRCNKLDPIMQPQSSIPATNQKSNAVYTCSPVEDGIEEMYIQDEGKFLPIATYLSDKGVSGVEMERPVDVLPRILSVDEYDVVPFDWNVKNIDKNTGEWLLYDYNLDKPPSEKQEEVLPEEANLEPVDCTKTQKELKSCNGLVKECKYRLQKVPYTAYRIENKFNNGEYLNAFGCVDGVSLSRCIKHCDDHGENCEGVEWNPAFLRESDRGDYLLSKDVCCPIRKLGVFEKRRKMHGSGKLYIKEKKHVPDSNYNYLFRYDPEKVDGYDPDEKAFASMTVEPELLDDLYSDIAEGKTINKVVDQVVTNVNQTVEQGTLS